MLIVCACCHLPSQASKAFYDNKEELLQLWCHETCRVIADRMWDPVDKDWLNKQLDQRLNTAFSTGFSTLFEPFNGEVCWAFMLPVAG